MPREGIECALRVGDAVRIFSRSADDWVDAKIVELTQDDQARVMYQLGAYWCRKTLHVHSQHIDIASGITFASVPHHDGITCSGDELCAHDNDASSVDDSVDDLTPGSESASVSFSFSGLDDLPLESEHVAIGTSVSSLRGHSPTPVPRQHLIQGGCIDLPTSPESYYLKPDFLLHMLKTGDVVLLKGSWLLECCKECHVLPRRQDLPREAIWDAADLETVWRPFMERFGEWRMDECPIPIISISHCWYSKEHPDPHGVQLQDVCLAVEARFAVPVHQPFRVTNLAIFWCWCSFYQLPRDTLAERDAFERSMQHMHIWYANRCTEVWMHTKVPHDAPNPATYHERGWTTWESTIAKFLTRSMSYTLRGNCILDLGDVVDRHNRGAQLSFADMVDNFARSMPCVPESPDAFACLIDEKIFTKDPATDRQLVKSNYQRNFKHMMGSTLEFSFDYLSLVQLNDMARDVLPHCTSLRTLCLTNCEIRAETKVFVSALQYCQVLRRLSLEYCGINSVGTSALASALGCHPALSTLNLQGNPIRDAGAQALADKLCCTNLEVVELCNCSITSVGAGALVGALLDPHWCPKLTLVWCEENEIGGEAEQQLEFAHAHRRCKIKEHLDLLQSAFVEVSHGRTQPDTFFAKLDEAKRMLPDSVAQQIHKAAQVQWTRHHNDQPWSS